MKGAMTLVVLAVASTALAAEPATPLTPPVLLPDGSQFKTWEQPLTFERTYHVDQNHPNASDNNPGTAELPFKTINKAAQVLEPGQHVVISAGVYREHVRPVRGGTSPDRVISYEAAPGAAVIITGSRELAGKWKPSRREQAAATWRAELPADLFGDENPFKLVNLTDEQIDKGMPWAVPIKGKLPNLLRRGLVFQDGQRLKQVAKYADLSEGPGAYWVEAVGQAIHVRPLKDVDPAQSKFEVTVRGMIFAPDTFCLGYIRVKGLTIQHAGNCFPRPQQGALSTQRGHHWIIEDCTIRQINAIGIDIGDQFELGNPDLPQGGQHVVRRNTITDCGIGGIEGKRIEYTLIEDNVIRRCGWQNIWPLYECAGIKVHCTHSCLLRRNLITDTIACPGIWMDYTNVNSRCSANVIINAQCGNGGIFMEASQVPNLVDNNIVWGTRGPGIYQHDCDELIIAHNLVAHSTDAAVRMQICKGRKVNGRLSTAKRNQILNNTFIANATQFSISDPENTSDYNVFSVDPGKPFDLARWQADKGWDKHSVTASIQAKLDPSTAELTWSASKAVPRFPGVPNITHDIEGKRRPGDTVAPGPFIGIPLEPDTVKLIPGPPKQVGFYDITDRDLPATRSVMLKDQQGAVVQLPTGEQIAVWAKPFKGPHPKANASDLVVEWGPKLGERYFDDNNYVPGKPRGGVWHDNADQDDNWHELYERTRQYKVTIASNRRSKPDLELRITVAAEAYFPSDEPKASLVKALETGSTHLRRGALYRIFLEINVGNQDWTSLDELRPLMTPLLNHEDQQVREGAQRCLCAAGDEATIIPLVLPEPQAKLRSARGGSLVAHWWYKTRSEKIVQGILAMLKSKDVAVREFAAAFFFHTPYPDGADALIDALDDPSPTVRRYALDGARPLTEEGQKRLIPKIIKLMADPSAEVRQEALRVSNRWNSILPVAVLIGKLKDKDANVRKSAAYALDCCRKPEVIAPLLEATRDDSAEVRAQAAVTLGRCHATSAFDRLVEMLADKEVDVRESAANGLRWLGDRRAIEPIRRALNTEGENWARKMMQRTIDELGLR